MKALILKIENWIRAIVAAEVKKIDASMHRERALLQAYMAAMKAHLEGEATRIMAEKTAVLTEGHDEVMKVRGSLMEEVQRIHTRLDAVEHAAVKGYDSAKAHLVEAAKSVLLSERATCSFCKRLVHSFTRMVDGRVICSDCKAKGE